MLKSFKWKCLGNKTIKFNKNGERVSKNKGTKSESLVPWALLRMVVSPGNEH